MSATVGPLPAGRSRAEMVAEVAANLASLRNGATVVVACSGGPDSSALAHLAADARPDLAIALVHVAHGLRARSAERSDRDVVATHASWLGVDLVGCDVEVASAGQGVEAAARDARYGALRAVADRRGAVAILVGHSADDQAETVLLRLARGTGIDGLAAMAIASGDLLRPLLRLRRADLMDFVVSEGLPVATDETNEDDAIRRVRVRREVLPALDRIGPDPVATLGRLAALARDDAAALAAAEAAVPDAYRTVGPVVAVRSEALRSVPVAVARRVVRRALADLVDRPPSAATVTRILDAQPGDAATLPGGLAFRAERAWRTLVRVDGVGGAAGTPARPEGWTAPGVRLALAAPGRWPWAAAGLALRLLVPAVDGSTIGVGNGSGGELAEGDPGDGSPVGGNLVHGAVVGGAQGHPDVDRGVVGEQIALSLPGAWAPPRHHVPSVRTAPGTHGARYAVTLPGEGAGLVVRAMTPGDRILGPGGTRRVVDVLRDAGMPRAVRCRWPIIEELGDDGRVVWIPGVAVDAERFAAGRREPALAIQATPC